MKKTATIFYLLSCLLILPMVAQQASRQAQIDSVVAILPQLPDTARLEALHNLVDLTSGFPSNKHYVKMLYEEAQNQQCFKSEGWALTALTALYYPQFDSDSVFIYGEEAIRFNRQHKLYENMFSANRNVIRRLARDMQILTALRRAEIAYSEAKELQEAAPMAIMLSIIAAIYQSIGQYEEAIRYMTESIEIAMQARKNSALRFPQNYALLIDMNRYLERGDEALRYVDSMQMSIKYINEVIPTYDTRQFIFQNEYLRVIVLAMINQPEQALDAIYRAEAVYDPLWEESSRFFGVMQDAMYGAYFQATGNNRKALEHYENLLNYYQNVTTNETGIHFTKKEMAKVYFEMADYKTAAELYRQMMQRREELNSRQFYEQLNEFRTIYELDKIEIEAERRQANIRQMRTIVVASLAVSVAMIIVATLVFLNRRKIAKKNRKLFSQMREQYKLEEELKKKNRYIQTLEERDKTRTHEKDTEAEMLEKINHIIKEQKIFNKSKIKPVDIAQTTGIPEKTLINCIKNKTGMNFIEYINNLRLLYARDLLFEKGKEMTVKAIIEEAGFNTRKTFYALFKEKFGVNPGEMLNSH